MELFTDRTLEDQLHETSKNGDIVSSPQTADALQTSDKQNGRLSSPLKAPHEDQPPPLPETHNFTQESPCEMKVSSTRKRKRTTQLNPTFTQDFIPPYSAATAEEKGQWKGFCEIESDPVRNL
jgi:hypothetical protein